MTIIKDIDALWPPFKGLCQRLLANCTARGQEYRITETYRTPERQAALYAQGRTRAGNIVTNSRLPSMHGFKLAMDTVAIVNGKSLWDVRYYQVLGEEAAKLGLEWGGKWRGLVDAPHVQLLPLYSPSGRGYLTMLRGGWYPKTSDYEATLPPPPSDWQVLWDWLAQTIPPESRNGHPVIAAFNRLRNMV